MEIPDILMSVAQAIVMPGAHPIDRRPQEDDDADVLSAGVEDSTGSRSGKQIEGRNLPDAGLFRLFRTERSLSIQPRVSSILPWPNPYGVLMVAGVALSEGMAALPPSWITRSHRASTSSTRK